MKRMILAAALSLTTSAFAQICEVDMIDIRTQRFITSFTAYDYNDGCKEGMKACRLEIRQRGQVGRADCVRVGNTNPVPTPVPRPEPYPQPQPYPSPSYDARRPLQVNESVIYANRFYVVAGISFNGLYTLRSTDGWNTISSNIGRENLSVVNGCDQNICTTESVINTNSQRYVKVIGISFNSNFVTQSTDGWNTIESNVERLRLAKTEGCVYGRYVQICVGNQVINSYNRYMDVIGIQLDGKVVLRSTDGWNTISANVDPSSLAVTR